jgi:hypothetical protein
MKITDKVNKLTKRFCYVAMGQVFTPQSSNNFYIRTSGVTDYEGRLLSNAVRLDNGLAKRFDVDEEVIVVDAELIVT